MRIFFTGIKVTPSSTGVFNIKKLFKKSLETRENNVKQGARTYKVLLTDGSTKWVKRDDILLKECSDLIEKYEVPSDDKQFCKRIKYHVDNYEEALRIIKEEKDPILYIGWCQNGLVPRLLACPANGTADPALTTQGTDTYNRVGTEYTNAGLVRPALSKTVIEQILLTTENSGIAGAQVGTLRSNANNTVTVISYNTSHQLQSALNRLMHLCPVLRWDQSGNYTEPAAECFRAYAYKTSNRPIEYDIATVRLNEFAH